MPTGRVRGATMTMRTDTKETTFVGDVDVHLKASTPAGGTTPVTPAFGRDSRQPVDVTSEQLYVNDAAKTALFMGERRGRAGRLDLEGARAARRLRRQGRVRADGRGCRSSRKRARDCRGSSPRTAPW